VGKSKHRKRQTRRKAREIDESVDCLSLYLRVHGICVRVYETRGERDR